MDWQRLKAQPNLLLVIAAGILLLLVGIYFFFLNSDPTDNSTAANSLMRPKDEEIEEPVAVQMSFYVEILGHVKNPGIYELEQEIMVIQLLEKAGGITSEADLQYIHKQLPLSTLVSKEQKIYIPAWGEAASGNSGSKNSNGKISLNHASKEELMTLSGVGESTADKIIAARPYTSIEQLLDVPGIGDSTYNKLVSQLTL